jgi:hypothetical protein
VEGVPLPVVGQTEAIYDTGTTQIVGDPEGIRQLYAPLLVYGAQPDSDGLYTSTWTGSAADQAPPNV